MSVEPNRDQAYWDRHWLKVARVIAEPATCSRLSVGAVLVVGEKGQGRIIAHGRNGAPAGERHCDHTMRRGVGVIPDEPDDMYYDPATGRLHCAIARHAEFNCLDYLPGNVSARGATLYLTHSPCPKCAQRIAESGVARVVYAEIYGALVAGVVAGTILDLMGVKHGVLHS